MPILGVFSRRQVVISTRSWNFACHVLQRDRKEERQLRAQRLVRDRKNTEQGGGEAHEAKGICSVGEA